jgi:hypothetical protein
VDRLQLPGDHDHCRPGRSAGRAVHDPAAAGLDRGEPADLSRGRGHGRGAQGRGPGWGRHRRHRGRIGRGRDLQVRRDGVEAVGGCDRGRPAGR